MSELLRHQVFYTYLFSKLFHINTIIIPLWRPATGTRTLFKIGTVITVTDFYGYQMFRCETNSSLPSNQHILLLLLFLMVA